LALAYVVRLRGGEATLGHYIAPQDFAAQDPRLHAPAVSVDTQGDQTEAIRTVAPRIEPAIGEIGSEKALFMTPEKATAHPDSVPLPTIDGAVGTAEQQELLRILAHAMAQAGLNCEMPLNVPKELWDLLNAWIEPLEAERSSISKLFKELVSNEIAERQRSGRYEVELKAPRPRPNEYIGWQLIVNPQDSASSIYHVVRVPYGDLPKTSVLRERTSGIDRDVATLARSVFDRIPK